MNAETPLAARSLWRRVAAFLYDARWVFGVYLTSRLVIFAVILLSRMIMVRAESWHPGGLLSVLGQWDADLWYLEVARNGYTFSTTFPSSVPFFPMFPLLVRLVSFVFHDMRIAGFVVSHSCLLAAGLFLHALVRAEYKDPRVSRVAVTFLMFNPAAFFFSHAYSESTFLMFAIGSFFFAVKGRWLPACLFAMCLSATRNVGVLISVSLLIEYLRQHRDLPFFGLFRPRVLWLGLAPLGLFAYLLFCYLKFGDPLAFLHASVIWDRKFVSPLVTWETLGRYNPFLKAWFLSSMGAAMLLWVLGVYFRVRASYLLFAGLLTVMYWCANAMEAWPRYLSVEFPLYIVLGVVASRIKWSYEPILAASIATLTIATLLSATGFWIT